MNPVIGCTNVGESEEMEEVRTENILIRDVETKNIMTKIYRTYGRMGNIS